MPNNTLAQALREILTQLDNAQATDTAYRNAFSSATRNRLRSGETWRKRLLRWCEREELLAMRD